MGNRNTERLYLGAVGGGLGVGVRTVLFSKYTPLYDGVSNLFMPIAKKLYLVFKSCIESLPDFLLPSLQSMK